MLFFSPFLYSQQTGIVDFISVKAVVRPLLKEKKVIATTSYTFKILKECDSVYLDAKGIFLLKNIKNRKIAIHLNNNKIWLVSKFKPNQTYTVFCTTSKTLLPSHLSVLDGYFNKSA